VVLFLNYCADSNLRVNFSLIAKNIFDNLNMLMRKDLELNQKRKLCYGHNDVFARNIKNVILE
jgi:hypothetical protein